MDLVNIFYGEEEVSEQILAYEYVKHIPENLLAIELNILEGAEAQYMTELNNEWYEEKLSTDDCLEKCKELWRTRFKLTYVRERFFGVSENDSNYVREPTFEVIHSENLPDWGGESMEEEDTSMDDITLKMNTMGCA